MPNYTCAGCSTQAATSKLSAGCSVVYYCSKECQRIDWTCHIFSCNPRRPINTGDYLALAVRKRELPEDTQTLVDWGIARAAKHHTVDDVDALLRMYAELLEWVGIKPLQLHKWRRGGNLVHRIKGVYDSLPDGHRSPGYQWLITHEDILETPLVTNEVLETIFDRMKRRVWLHLGHSPSASSDEITDFIQSLPALRRTCFMFIAVCLEDMYPPITSDLYLNFGFGACRGPKGYNALGRAYHDLMLMVSFEQFYEAYNSGKLYELFTAKNVAVALDEIELAGLADILAGAPGANKTVWDLQQFIADVDTPRGALSERACIDYGYEMSEDDPIGQCKLSHLYKIFFANSKAEPLALHKACMEGRLLAFFEDDMGMDLGKDRRLYKRLLKPFNSHVKS